MPTLTGLTTNFFATPNEGFTTTTSAPVDSSSATVVPFNSVSGLTNGSIFTGLIDPGNAKERAFTGVVDTGGSQITSVKFTTGTNATHTTGATIVDYVTGTHFGAMTKGILIHSDQDGTLKSGAVDVTAVLADSIVTKDKLSTAFELEHDTGWNLSYAGTTLAAPNTITNNGNRSYDVVFNSVDYTNFLSAGQRLRLTRTVSAPTQCADLEASSSQAFTVTNAVGLATGTTWTIKARIKPESYSLGVIFAVDDNAAATLQMYMLATGQIVISGGSAATYDVITSYQSVQLDEWQEVTASITVGTPTGEIRINDVVVPSFVTNSAATTVTLSGDEEIYIGRNAAGNYFDGKICQVALFNAVISDATLKTYSGQTMTGSETSCEGFWPLNGVLTDSSANGNTLVAGGGALATNVDSPFGNYLGGTLDYAIITKTAFSTNTTLTVQVPEGCTIPTSGGVSAVAYSTQDSPYGFPKDSGRWELGATIRTSNSTTSNATYGSFISGGFALTVPVGAWRIGYSLGITNGTTTNVFFNLSPTSVAGLSAGSEDIRYTVRTVSASAGNTSTQNTITNSELITAAASWVMYTLGATTSCLLNGSTSKCSVYAEFAYL